MKNVKFKGCNIEIAKDQKEYKTLNGLDLCDQYGTKVFCYKLGLWERVQVLFLGRIWASMLTFNRPLTPHRLDTARKRAFLRLYDGFSFIDKVKHNLKKCLHYRKSTTKSTL